jgi:catechol 2,3-dioxygenase-like lactoylglutathione lyase family enzyme
MGDRATPNLPSRDFGATSDFYGRLGFAEQFRDDGWMILARGSLVLEFFPYPDLDPATSSFGSCLRLDDLDEFFEVCVAAGVPETTRGWPRLHAPRLEESGLRIGALLDPDDSLLRLIANPAPVPLEGRS